MTCTYRLALGALLCWVGTATAGWETLEGCRLLSNPSNDGDSFHVEHKGKEYIFRLYFVDCPEMEDAVPDRVDEQAAFLGIKRTAVLEAGRAAARFTIATLRGSFTVYTRWEDAKGDSQLQRFFAIVEIGGKDLAELLAANGFCRVYGKMVDGPDGRSSSAKAQRLDSLAQAAKRGNRGIWGALDAPSAGNGPDTPTDAPAPAAAGLYPSSTGAAPEAFAKITCPGRATAYSPRPPFKTIGTFEAGTELEVIARLPDAMVQVRYTAASGKVTFAACKYFELGLGAE